MTALGVSELEDDFEETLRWDFGRGVVGEEGEVWEVNEK